MSYTFGRAIYLSSLSEDTRWWGAVIGQTSDDTSDSMMDILWVSCCGEIQWDDYLQLRDLPHFKQPCPEDRIRKHLAEHKGRE